MHLANGTLANDVCTVTAAVSAAAIGYALIRARRNLSPSLVARAAVGSAVVLAAQMIDVPLFNEFPVHVIGAAFLTLLVGPALALPGMATVVVFQALVLHDGGITTLGANVFNMAVVAVAVAALCIQLARGRLAARAGLFVAAGVAGAASVLAATLAMTLEFVVSGVSPAAAVSLTMPAHAPFAAWETVTTLVLVLVAAQARAIKPLAASSSN